ncbi:site-specific recombinase XerD [Neorhizobium sp. R1-B]|uniref:tyrosine-type recombinase/integrase n=1 Tax=Neorhizobium sp. R1-B TaxID=2485162 RepID=UPI0010D773EB|nr:site-specific integrase [Neorhizobium sp. R1-B]TDX72635.1 site-specific recombinase XerD [Neorhizobium sp. R1-B]
MSKMYPKLPKGVTLDRDWRTKEPRFYFRAPGRPKVRLTEEPGSVAFENEVACARLGVPYLRPGEKPKPEPLIRAPNEGTLDWLVLKYKARAGNTMAPDQLARRARLLEKVCDSLTPKKKNRRGDLPVDKIERKHILEIRDELAQTAGAQDNLVKYISAMFGWAIENDLVKINPALRIKKVGGGTGFHTWTVDEVKQFEAKHPPGTKAHLMLSMALFTGLRLQELAIMGRQHVRDGWLTIRPGKTSKSSGVTVQIPILPELQKRLDDQPAKQMTYLVTEYGKPFTVNGLGNKMRDWCDDAGLFHCSTHGLRKAGATIAAENGATDDELMAIFGWTTKKQTTLYTKQANRKKLAAGAIHKLRSEQTSNENCPTPEGVVKSGTKREKKPSKNNA